MSGNALLVDIIHFAAFADSTELLYTKYNFNYDKWAQDFGLPMDKLLIFKDFLKRNGTTYDQPYSVKPEFEQYFFPITQDIVNYMVKYGYSIHSNYLRITSPPTFISSDILVKQQFDLIEYSDQEIQRVVDYFFIADEENKEGHTKYNFDFVNYSKDWKVYGSKLFIYTDFIVRCIYLSGTIPGAVGYGLPPGFNKKYFIEVEGLTEYLVDYSVTSVFPNQFKRVNNINWLSYRELNPDLDQQATIPQLREHYYLYGQFELRKFLFNQGALNNIRRAENSVGLMYSPGNRKKLIGTGFLIENDSPTSIISNKYFITAYHLIENSKNKVTVRAIFSIQSTNTLIEPKNIEIEFLVIGYFKTLDILVCAYNPNSEWNIINNIDINIVPVLQIDPNISLQKNDIVNYIGNVNQNVLQASLQGNVIDERYFGQFGAVFDIAPPTTAVVNINSVPGVSGSPLLVFRNTSYICVGLVTNTLVVANIYTQALRATILVEAIQRAIDTYAFYFQLYFGNFTKIYISLQTAAADTICWIGSVLQYYDAINSRNRYDALSSFTYVGGILITDLIEGFNPVTRSFVVNSSDLVDLNTIPIYCPFQNTLLQRRFIESGYQPIVLKSLTTYIGQTGSATYRTYYFGNYGDQSSFNIFSYGLVPVGTYRIKDLDLPKSYTNVVYSIYPELIFNYFYFNGSEWIEESITINFSEKDLVEYKDNLGNLYLQNPLDYPIILIPYAKPYYAINSINSLFGDPVLYWDGISTSGTLGGNISNTTGNISNTTGSISNSTGSISNTTGGNISNPLANMANLFSSIAGTLGGNISNATGGNVSNTH